MSQEPIVYKNYVIYWQDFALATIGHDELIGIWKAYPISPLNGDRIASLTTGQVLSYPMYGEISIGLNGANADCSTSEFQKAVLKDQAYKALTFYIDAH